LTVKRLSGQGTVVLRIREADSFAEQGLGVSLPGVGSGAPNVGYLAPFVGPSLIVPSRVLFDPSARSLNVLNLAGEFRPGWPVFVFPGGSAQGGLTQPMSVNLDGVPGDEIVVASDFGLVYFFDGWGITKSVALAFNRPLTAPVGFQNAVGGWRVLVVDKLGWVRTWSWNAAVGTDPELENELFLDHKSPLLPAAGRLTNGGGESVVIAFADGWVVVLDEHLALRSGWPRDLATPLAVAPVLCDLDGDNLHEVVLPVLDEASGQLVMRVFDGAGNSLVHDGSVVPAPDGGRWLGISEAAVSGWYDTGGLNVAVAGVADNGLTGSAAAWSMGLGRLFADGTTSATALPGFTVSASTAEGLLRLENLLLPTPLAWNQSGGFSTEVATLFHVAWNEILYGFTSIPGATTGWLLTGYGRDPLVQKQPLLLGGSRQTMVTYLGSMLVPLADGLNLRVEIIDSELGQMPVFTAGISAPRWWARRADARNSGSYPLQTTVSAVVGGGLTVGGLRAYPNPGRGRFRFSSEHGQLPADTQLEIFDLRGHRIQRINGADIAGVMTWDGADERGRRVAAGTYLAVVRSGSERLTSRVVLTR